MIVMLVQWNKIIVWLFIEISFNLLGIDEVLDCSEFLFHTTCHTNEITFVIGTT